MPVIDVVGREPDLVQPTTPNVECYSCRRSLPQPGISRLPTLVLSMPR